MTDPHPPSAAAAEATLVTAVLLAWDGFYQRFREDERSFEQVNYLEETVELTPRLEAMRGGGRNDVATLVEALGVLEAFAHRRFFEQNRRIDELMDLCEQMRQRLEMSELNRSHLEDEIAHSQAVVKAAIDRLKLGSPQGLDHAPRLHNLISHLLAHFEPHGDRFDTARFQKSPDAARRSDEAAKSDEPVFDYERLRRLFRKG
jgi:hypothetical protein